MMMLLGLFNVGMIIIGMVSFSTSINDFDSSRSPIVGFVPFFVAFAVMFVGICVTMCWMAKVGKQVEEEVRSVCEETSNSHSGISFHVREERYLTTHGSDVRSGRSNYIEGVSCQGRSLFQ